MKSRRHFLKATLLFSPVLAFPKNIFGKTNKRLPNVLILGDSISIGYFPFVKEIIAPLKIARELQVELKISTGG